jgi:hypothetical protein
VVNWQSSNSPPPRRSAATSQANATFEASDTRENMLSPQNTRAKPTPYNPPTSRSTPSGPVIHVSIECAAPSACNWR